MAVACREEKLGAVLGTSDFVGTVLKDLDR